MLPARTTNRIAIFLPALLNQKLCDARLDPVARVAETPHPLRTPCFRVVCGGKCVLKAGMPRGWSAPPAAARPKRPCCRPTG